VRRARRRALGPAAPVRAPRPPGLRARRRHSRQRPVPLEPAGARHLPARLPYTDLVAGGGRLRLAPRRRRRLAPQGRPRLLAAPTDARARARGPAVRRPESPPRPALLRADPGFPARRGGLRRGQALLVALGPGPARDPARGLGQRPPQGPPGREHDHAAALEEPLPD